MNEQKKSQQSSVIPRQITRLLNIYGWSHLDAVLLAALATESPVLLIGAHGTAKSMLIERLASAMGLSMRHYNAALINYDDLVGFPYPDKESQTLVFIPTPASIWGTEFVFFDEISRCRPDVQNKLYSIIHERRIMGMPLEELQHRWSAMNPPAPEDPNNVATYYLGSEPLDPALTDRFPFVIMVPNWSDMPVEERHAIVAWDSGDVSENVDLDLPALVRETKALIPQVEASFAAWLGEYIIGLMDLLEKAQLPQSPRRARMLARNVAAIHAARMVLENEDVDSQVSAEMALLYGMPQTANEVPPSSIKLVALHRQAWELAQCLEDVNWRQVLSEYDVVRRVVLADELNLNDSDLSRIITQTLSVENSNPRQMSLAVAMFLAFHQRRDLDPVAFEPLAQLAHQVITPRFHQIGITQNSNDSTLWKDIRNWIDNQVGREESPIFRLERNYLLRGFPDWWRTHNWVNALTQFREDLKLFGIYEETFK